MLLVVGMCRGPNTGSAASGTRIPESHSGGILVARQRRGSAGTPIQERRHKGTRPPARALSIQRDPKEIPLDCQPGVSVGGGCEARSKQRFPGHVNDGNSI